MNSRVLYICAAVWIFLGNGAFAAPQMLPGGDPIVSCVSPVLKWQLDGRGSWNDTRQAGYYPDIIKALTCILKASPLSHDENGVTMLRLRTQHDEVLASRLGIGNIGPHWVSLNKQTDALSMEGMVYIGGDLRGNCTWKYENVSGSFKGVSGEVNCVNPDAGTHIDFEPRFSKAWLEDSIYDCLEVVLYRVIRIHDNRYKER
jgi:hypothetical protein